jgi:hypothetical protein
MLDVLAPLLHWREGKSRGKDTDCDKDCEEPTVLAAAARVTPTGIRKGHLFRAFLLWTAFGIYWTIRD